MSRFRKPLRPMPNRSMSLWRGCLFAFCAGWEKGFWADGSQSDAAIEDQRRGRGIWVGSLDDSNYASLDMGRVLDEGLSDDRIGWADTLNRYDNPNGFMSAAVLTRPDTIQNSEQAVFSKQDGPVPNSGWGITVSFGADPNPNGWHFQINDGAVREFSVANTQSASRSDILVMTYDRSNLIGFQNGARIGSVAASGLITQNNNDLRLFGDAVQPNYQGRVGMAALWNRPLTASEVARLQTDPYVMWRTDLHKEFMFGNVGGARSYQTFFLNFG